MSEPIYSNSGLKVGVIALAQAIMPAAIVVTSLYVLSIDSIKRLFAGRCPLLADAGTCVQRSLPRTDRR